MKKLFIVLQETTGEVFGPRVQQQVHQVEEECGNIIVRCTLSADMI